MEWWNHAARIFEFQFDLKLIDLGASTIEALDDHNDLPCLFCVMTRLVSGSSKVGRIPSGYWNDEMLNLG